MADGRKAAIVTGAASGLGRAMALGLAGGGIDVLAVDRNAQALAAGLIEKGFRLVSGGTDNHLVLVDLRPSGITGKDAQVALDRAGITCNKNTIPFDPESPFVTSGIRLGTAAVTTAGMKEPQMPVIAGLIAQVLRKHDDRDVAADVLAESNALCAEFAPYPSLV